MNKKKNQVISVPTSKSLTKSKPKKTALPTKNTKIKNLVKPRATRTKENTVAYYNCLIDKVANPSAKTKITQLAHYCKCSKNEVAQAQAIHKQQLIQKLAQSYKNFGESLGHYLHADIVGCAKNLEK